MFLPGKVWNGRYHLQLYIVELTEDLIEKNKFSRPHASAHK